ncbi:DUF1062 domain-containing protein [Actinomadura logoneensis]|uniref:DUF1062 domain-containing protein n=1 Tax=Actinomadura logoneensis TaxID=2293572 RepID=A0A372JKR2_9ACTN|nr:DUF1062 domain-containing protein [Actinomadura logoneensis]
MSSQPHIVLPWIVRRTRLPLLSLRCAHCRTGSATTGDGRFRVNANGKLLDVWLLVRCVACDRTAKLTVHERMPVRSIDPDDLHGYRVNDPELVAARLLDPRLAHRNRFTLDWTGAWRLDVRSAWTDEPWPVQVDVRFEDPVPVRPDRLIADGLGLSRNEVLRRTKSETTLSRPTSTDFTFTVMPDPRLSLGRPGPAAVGRPVPDRSGEVDLRKIIRDSHPSTGRT